MTFNPWGETGILEEDLSPEEMIKILLKKRSNSKTWQRVYVKIIEIIVKEFKLDIRINYDHNEIMEGQQ